MGVLDTAKPFYRLELFEPGATDAKFIISPNIFLDTERPSDDAQISQDIYLTDLNVTSRLGGVINLCELKIKHGPGNAPAIKLNSKVKVYLGYYYLDSTQGAEYSLVYTGYVARINVHLQETELECRSQLHQLNSVKKKMTYSTMMTLDEVINKLAIDEGGLELASDGIAQTDIKKQPGFSISENKSLLDHIKSMAWYSCLYLYMDVTDNFHAAAWAPGDLTARSGDEEREWISERDKTESGSTSVYKHELTFGRDLIACDFTLTPGSASSIQVICLMSSGEDTADTLEPPIVEYTPSDGADPDLPQKTYNISHVTREDAEKIAENLYFTLNINLVGKANTLGSPQIRLGDGISITGDIYEVDPYQNLDFSSANSSGSDLASKVFQVIRINHIFNNSDGFITRLDFVDARATPEAEGGEGGEEEEEEEEGEEEEDEEEEEEEEEEEGEEGEEEEEDEEEEDEREEIEFLKLPGINFNFDSAIVLTRDLGDIKGIINVVNETEAKVLIAGHTDRMGTDTYNLNLSLLRAKSVLAICTGNRSTFREILDSGKWKIEDYQMILNDFGFYNGPEDGKERPENNEAIRDFQVYYNANLRSPLEESEADTGTEEADEEEAPEIAIDGIIGNQTWDAIFRTMVRVMDANIDDAKFVDTRIIGCGEFRPIERPSEDQVRSEINRRVEFLLYPEETFPDIRGQPASRDATNAAYNDELFRFEEITFDTILPNLPLGEMTVTDLSWNADVARRGETLNLTANVENVGDDTKAVIEIYEFDTDGKHDLIKKIETKVKNGRIDEKWDYEYIKDTDEIPTEEESEKGYNPPEYFFIIDIGGTKFGELQESGLLGFKDFIEINLKDINNEPIADQEFTLQLPNGSEINGKVNSEGYARVDDIPPGKVRIKFIKE
jgi:outer membrane protein OmpA-like peptidoglycan-associated protein